MLQFLSGPALLILISCSPSTETPDNGTRANQIPESEVTTEPTALADYLFVWARDKEREQTDFFSVFNVNPQSEQYGQLVSTVPMGVVANAHHTEHFMSEGNRLFMNGFKRGGVGPSLVVEVIAFTTTFLSISTPYSRVLMPKTRFSRPCMKSEFWRPILIATFDDKMVGLKSV